MRHPNIVTIYGAERIGDTIGLWMERVDGETVEQRLSRQSPLKPSVAIEIGIQICHAVAAVHKAGLLHRDIKAQNVMLAIDGRAVLMDFGTGRELVGASASLTSLAGTPLYLAPELLRGGDADDSERHLQPGRAALSDGHRHVPGARAQFAGSASRPRAPRARR